MSGARDNAYQYMQALKVGRTGWPVGEGGGLANTQTRHIRWHRCPAPKLGPAAVQPLAQSTCACITKRKNNETLARARPFFRQAVDGLCNTCANASDPNGNYLMVALQVGPPGLPTPHPPKHTRTHTCTCRHVLSNTCAFVLMSTAHPPQEPTAISGVFVQTATNLTSAFVFVVSERGRGAPQARPLVTGSPLPAAASGWDLPTPL